MSILCMCSSPLVRCGLLEAIDDEDIDRALGRFQFEAKLLWQDVEHGGGQSVGP